jgi:RNA polymerase sigma factor (sigma-70 family)
MPMAHALAERVTTSWPREHDELRSTAFLALVEAAQLFDPSRNVNFATYARHRIRGALRDYQRLLYSAGWRGDRAHAPVFRTLEKDSEQYGQVLGIQPEPPVGAAAEVAEAVEEWLQRLPKAHAAVCRLIYLHGKSQDEAAKLVGCSKSFVSRIHREAITWLIQDYQQARAGRDLDFDEPSA